MEFPETLLHVEYIPIRWGDMDLLGHVNNTIYFRYLEQTRISWFESIGVSAHEGEGPILGRVSCKFIKPVLYPGVIEVNMLATGLGRSSFHLRHELRRGDDPHTIYAQGECTMVWIDFAAGKSRTLPESMRRRLAGERP